MSKYDKVLLSSYIFHEDENLEITGWTKNSFNIKVIKLKSLKENVTQ